MNKSDAIMELLGGYEAYSEAEELNVSAAMDAPATTLPCGAAATISWLASQFSARTISGGC
ncbi:MAG TPA: LxmA leader domain family RiPP [Micromonospora sp.]|nr:LxmA leader domain family RiPP [Micromonospora sp.]